MVVLGEVCAICLISRKIQTQQKSMVTPRVMPNEGTQIYSALQLILSTDFL